MSGETTVTPGGDVPATEVRLFSGWGRTAPTTAEYYTAESAKRIASAFDDAPARGQIARGLGRSYGDAAQCAGGRVIDCTPYSQLDEIDLETGRVTAAAGTSLDQLMRWLLPLGWFVPVTPGTRYVTVGGAIAADIHGKNHHVDGSFCEHVESFNLQLPDGQQRTVSPSTDAELFWATAGGMGLTGVVVDATFRMTRVESSRLIVDTDRTADLDSLMAMMEESDDDYRFSVAWIDLVTTGTTMGRGILTRGRFATLDQVEGSVKGDPRAFAPRMLASAPPFVPPRLLNPLTIRAFNEFWYRKAPRHRVGELQTISQFFHPLDLVDGWNRIYGRHGFLQWQVVVPYGEESTLRALVDALSSHGCPSFLAVLKRFGRGNPGPLSFPTEGWTLALDIPGGVPGVGPLLDRLDRQVAEAGGRVYLAKDSRLRPELLPVMYPRLDEWRQVRERVDPQQVLQSDLSRRLGL
jgi:decaprenylphospho-beta-D-ribofuranose 2-oxidase